MTVSLQSALGVVPVAVDRTDAIRIAVAQLGARRHYAVPRILHEAGLLETFYTDLYAGAGWPARLVNSVPQALRTGPLHRLASRTAELPPEQVRQFASFGVARRMRKFRRNSPAGTRQAQLAANRRFGQLVADCGLGNANAVYVFNGAGLEILQAARARGLHTILDQTSAPVELEEQLAREERERWPEWETGGTPEAVWRPFAERERTEWSLADAVICGSQHVCDCLADAIPAGVPIKAVPYGVDPQRYPGRVRAPANRPLRVLFVGHVRLLKGIQYLAAASRLLQSKDVEVRIVGHVKVSARAVAELGRSVQIAGQVQRGTIGGQYDWADVFVLPTLSEGSAAVCYEALASGLPVITTPQSGSVVVDGRDGFLIPMRDPAAIADKIDRLARDRELLAHLSEQALVTAAAYTTDTYRERLGAAIRDVIRNRCSAN